ncbi:hypothetical protein LDENG_00166270 [Lucifuga dentata]|nr:hypothetical protein LDENG_00166270 [Lucifuga dentata]
MTVQLNVKLCFQFFTAARERTTRKHHSALLTALKHQNDLTLGKKTLIDKLFTMMDYLSQERFKYHQVDFNSRMN